MPPYMPLTADSCLVVYTVEDKTAALAEMAPLPCASSAAAGNTWQRLSTTNFQTWTWPHFSDLGTIISSLTPNAWWTWNSEKLCSIQDHKGIDIRRDTVWSQV